MNNQLNQIGMKKALPFLLVILFGMTFISRAQDCYKSTRSQGVSLYNQGKREEAKGIFEAAKKCPDKPEKDDLDTWITKCESAPAAMPVGKLTIESMTFSGGTHGDDVTSCYLDEFLALSPKVVVNNSGKAKKKAKVSITITDPYGDKLDLGGSDKYSEIVEKTFNKGKTELEFSAMGRFTNQPTDGDYYFEIWINDKLAKTASFEVLERPTILAVNNNTRDFDVVLGHSSGIQMFTIRTNNRFEVKHKPSWVNVESVVEDAFTISYSENSSKEVREGLMDICTVNGKKTIVVTLRQEGRPEVAAVSKPTSKIGLGFCLPSFVSSASNELGSVIDYGVTDVPGLASLEEPNYKGVGGISINYGFDYPIVNDIFFETGIGFTYLKLSNTFANNRLVYTYNGTRFDMDYGCNEKYSISYLQVPALLGYDLKIGVNSSVRFSAGLVMGIGISAKCNLENGYSNYTTDDVYANSVYSGSVDLYSGRYHITQTYSTGEQPTFEYKDELTAPFKRFDMGVNVGTSFVIGSFEVGLAYNAGLLNIARNDYFSSTNRVGGCLFVGDVIRTEQGMNDYKHKVNILRFYVNYML